jgi:hypothetical protein
MEGVEGVEGKRLVEFGVALGFEGEGLLLSFVTVL